MHAARMHAVKLSITIQYVVAQLDMSVIRSLDVIQKKVRHSFVRSFVVSQQLNALSTRISANTTDNFIIISYTFYIRWRTQCIQVRTPGIHMICMLTHIFSFVFLPNIFAHHPIIYFIPATPHSFTHKTSTREPMKS